MYRAFDASVSSKTSRTDILPTKDQDPFARGRFRGSPARRARSRTRTPRRARSACARACPVMMLESRPAGEQTRQLLGGGETGGGRERVGRAPAPAPAAAARTPSSSLVGSKSTGASGTVSPRRFVPAQRQDRSDQGHGDRSKDDRPTGQMSARRVFSARRRARSSRPWIRRAGTFASYHRHRHVHPLARSSVGTHTRRSRAHRSSSGRRPGR